MVKAALTKVGTPKLEFSPICGANGGSPTFTEMPGENLSEALCQQQSNSCIRNKYYSAQRHVSIYQTCFSEFRRCLDKFLRALVATRPLYRTQLFASDISLARLVRRIFVVIPPQPPNTKSSLLHETVHILRNSNRPI